MSVSHDLVRRPPLRMSLPRAARRACLVKAWELNGLTIAAYYRKLLRQHGRSPQALAERSDQKEMQFYNHLFSPADPLRQASVLDVGCGMGGLIEFLHGREMQITSYQGIDIVEPFVGFCRKCYPDSYRFQRINFISRSFAPAEKFDLVVSMGVMVSRVFQYERYVAYCIKKMMRLADKYVLFNIITEVNSSLGNYKHTDRIGNITYIPRDTLIDILDRTTRSFNATFDIHETRIYLDATDAFVCIRMG